MAIIISLEGNIGAGKTTMLKQLIHHLESLNYKNYVVIDEPVQEWMTPIPSIYPPQSIFELYYNNQTTYGFLFQMIALQTRLQKLLEAVKKYPNHVIITERCHQTDQHIFAKMLKEAGKMTEVEKYVYDQWYNMMVPMLEAQCSKILYLYLQTSPSVCVSRIQHRARAGEHDKISVDYIESLHKYHEDWLLKLCKEDAESVYIYHSNSEAFIDFVSQKLVRSVL
jgi:deoxyguanosine kinase